MKTLSTLSLALPLSLSLLLTAGESHARGAPAAPSQTTIQAPAAPCAFSTGFYGGAKVGWSHMRVKFKTNFQDSAGDQFPVSSTKKGDGIMGALFVGFQKVWPNTYVLGLELEGLLDTVDANTTVTPRLGATFKLKAKRRWGIIPNLVAGKVINDHFMVYVKGGLGIQNHRLTIYDAERRESFGKTKTNLSFIPAVGAKYAITECISLVGEVAYSLPTNGPKKRLERNPADVDFFSAKAKDLSNLSVQMGLAVKLM